MKYPFLLLSLLLAACSQGYEPRPEPRVMLEVGTVIVPVTLKSSKGGMAAEQKAVLSRAATSIPERNLVGVDLVAEPKTTGWRTARDVLQDSRRLPNPYRHLHDAELGAKDVRVNLHTAKLNGPECHYYEALSRKNHNNDKLPGMGCATANNNAQMIYFPEDVMGNSSQTPLDTELSARAVQQYRTGVPANAPPVPVEGSGASAIGGGTSPGVQ